MSERQQHVEYEPAHGGGCIELLRYRDQKLAVIEAKRAGLDTAEGVAQAKEYARRLKTGFAYATNGHDIYQIDMLTGDESLVDDYQTPEQLWELTFDSLEPVFASTWRKRFAAIPFDQ